MAAGRFLDFLRGLGKLGLNLVVFGGQVVSFGLDVLDVSVVFLFKLREIIGFCLVAGWCWPLSVLKLAEVVRDSLNLLD